MVFMLALVRVLDDNAPDKADDGAPTVHFKMEGVFMVAVADKVHNAFVVSAVEVDAERSQAVLAVVSVVIDYTKSLVIIKDLELIVKQVDGWDPTCVENVMDKVLNVMDLKGMVMAFFIVIDQHSDN